MKRSDILRSNFIVFFSLLIAALVSGFLFELVAYFLNSETKEFSHLFQVGIFGALFSFFTYGLLVWPFILLSNLLIEIFGLRKSVSISDVKKIFLTESVIISLLVFFVAFKYQFYYWLILIPLFVIIEMIRFHYLNKKHN